MKMDLALIFEATFFVLLTIFLEDGKQMSCVSFVLSLVHCGEANNLSIAWSPFACSQALSCKNNQKIKDMYKTYNKLGVHGKGGD